MNLVKVPYLIDLESKEDVLKFLEHNLDRLAVSFQEDSNFIEGLEPDSISILTEIDKLRVKLGKYDLILNSMEQALGVDNNEAIHESSEKN